MEAFVTSVYWAFCSSLLSFTIFLPFQLVFTCGYRPWSDLGRYFTHSWIEITHWIIWPYEKKSRTHNNIKLDHQEVSGWSAWWRPWRHKLSCLILWNRHGWSRLSTCASGRAQRIFGRRRREGRSEAESTCCNGAVMPGTTLHLRPENR